MAVDGPAWAEARRLYTAGDLTLVAIADSVGVSVSRLRRRAKAEGWIRRRAAVDRQPSPRAGRDVAEKLNRSTAAEAPDRRADDRALAGGNVRAAVVNRLYRAIDIKLKRLESRMQSGKTLTAADSERETRELGTMVRSFEKVTELASDLERSRQSAGASRRGDVSAADAERMRREIAERLERLAGRRHD